MENPTVEIAGGVKTHPLCIPFKIPFSKFLQNQTVIYVIGNILKYILRLFYHYSLYQGFNIT